MRLGDIDAATEQKRRLEEKQRIEERKRESLRTPWQPKYFIQEVTATPLLPSKRVCTKREANRVFFLMKQFGNMGTGRTGRSWAGLGTAWLSSFAPEFTTNFLHQYL